ncbi:hypothetical protein AAHA92_29397 [Salvia divinorum]|uniref:Uncharacterized protein n=1 Tax=Salvia divinorum TaxID=28513 RepID=A0ABD1G1F7_SALDI
MVLPIPHQNSFLYTTNWTPCHDSALLHTWQLGYAFKWEELYDRFTFMELRYHTFNSILDVHGTFWNCDDNSMMVLDSHLEPLFTINPMADTYYPQGEPVYNELTTIFGFKKVKEEKEHQ